MLYRYNTHMHIDMGARRIQYSSAQAVTSAEIVKQLTELKWHARTRMHTPCNSEEWHKCKKKRGKDTGKKRLHYLEISKEFLVLMLPKISQSPELNFVNFQKVFDSINMDVEAWEVTECNQEFIVIIFYVTANHYS